MVTGHRERVRAALRAAPGEAFAGFVVGVYRARGHDAAVVDDRTVRIDDRRVHVHRPRRVPVPFPARIPDGVDAVVTPGTGRPWGVPPDVAVIDGDALYELAVFGIDGDDRRRLFETFLDGRPADVAPDPGDPKGVAAASDGPAGDRPVRIRTLHVALGVLALALIAVAVVGLPAVSEEGARPSGDGIGTLTPFDAGVTTDRPASAPTPVPPPADAYPPGVNASDLVDPEALLVAHVRGLDGLDYRLVMVYREFYTEHGQAGWRRLIATVDRPASARTSVETGRAVIGFDDPVPARDLYADGNAVYYRNWSQGRTRYRIKRPDRSPARTRVFGGPHLADALAANGSRLVGTTVRNGTRLFRLRLIGDADPEPFTERAIGVLMVDSQGHVHRFRRIYRSETEPITIEVSLRYLRGSFDVDPPPWLEEARMASKNRTTTRRNQSATAGD